MTDDLIEQAQKAVWNVGGYMTDDQWRAAVAIIAPAVLDMAILETSSLCAEETCCCCCDILSDAATAILALKAQFQTETQV